MICKNCLKNGITTKSHPDTDMTEEDFRQAINNILMMQNNNDQNFQILQAQIDNLQKQLTDLNDLKEMFRLPKPENKDRKAFDEVD